MSENCTHNCETCGENCASRKTNPADFREPPHALSSIKKVIGVVSGKGGVGKSMTSAMLAVLLNRRGYKTGVLDADITGPSIPKLFGIHGRAHADEVGCYPVQSRTVMQFWQEVSWKDVDFLFVDMPPGTGDVPLTVFQTLPVDGIVVVASPQELVSLIVAKAVNMANMMNIPVLGLVENMSYVLCPDCGKKIDVFGESHVAETAAEFGVPVLARIPIDPQLARQADLGVIESFEGDMLDGAADAIEKLL